MSPQIVPAYLAPLISEGDQGTTTGTVLSTTNPTHSSAESAASQSAGFGGGLGSSPNVPAPGTSIDPATGKLHQAGLTRAELADKKAAAAVAALAAESSGPINSFVGSGGGLGSSPNVPAPGTSIDPTTGKPHQAGLTRAELEAKKAAAAAAVSKEPSSGFSAGGLGSSPNVPAPGTSIDPGTGKPHQAGLTRAELEVKKAAAAGTLAEPAGFAGSGGGLGSSPNVPTPGTSIDPATGKPHQAGLTRAELESKKASAAVAAAESVLAAKGFAGFGGGGGFGSSPNVPAPGTSIDPATGQPHQAGITHAELEAKKAAEAASASSGPSGLSSGFTGGGLASSPLVPKAGESIDPATGRPHQPGLTRAELAAIKAKAAGGDATASQGETTSGQELPGGWGATPSSPTTTVYQDISQGLEKVGAAAYGILPSGLKAAWSPEDKGKQPEGEPSRARRTSFGAFLEQAKQTGERVLHDVQDGLQPARETAHRTSQTITAEVKHFLAETNAAAKEGGDSPFRSLGGGQFTSEHGSASGAFTVEKGTLPLGSSSIPSLTGPAGVAARRASQEAATSTGLPTSPARSSLLNQSARPGEVAVGESPSEIVTRARALSSTSATKDSEPAGVAPSPPTVPATHSPTATATTEAKSEDPGFGAGLIAGVAGLAAAAGGIAVGVADKVTGKDTAVISTTDKAPSSTAKTVALADTTSTGDVQTTLTAPALGSTTSAGPTPLDFSSDSVGAATKSAEYAAPASTAAIGSTAPTTNTAAVSTTLTEAKAPVEATDISTGTQSAESHVPSAGIAAGAGAAAATATAVGAGALGDKSVGDSGPAAGTSSSAGLAPSLPSTALGNGAAQGATDLKAAGLETSGAAVGDTANPTATQSASSTAPGSVNGDTDEAKLSATAFTRHANSRTTSTSSITAIKGGHEGRHPPSSLLQSVVPETPADPVEGTQPTPFGAAGVATGASEFSDHKEAVETSGSGGLVDHAPGSDTDGVGHPSTRRPETTRQPGIYPAAQHSTSPHAPVVPATPSSDGTAGVGAVGTGASVIAPVTTNVASPTKSAPSSAEAHSLISPSASSGVKGHKRTESQSSGKRKSGLFSKIKAEIKEIKEKI